MSDPIETETGPRLMRKTIHALNGEDMTGMAIDMIMKMIDTETAVSIETDHVTAMNRGGGAGMMMLIAVEIEKTENQGEDEQMTENLAEGKMKGMKITGS